jgi:hypothetical protein
MNPKLATATTLILTTGNTKGGSCMTTHNFCFYLQNRLIQTRRSMVQ